MGGVVTQREQSREDREIEENPWPNPKQTGPFLSIAERIHGRDRQGEAIQNEEGVIRKNRVIKR